MTTLLGIKEDPDNIKYPPWREVYASALVGDLVINGICPGFPIYVDWFYIPTNSPEIWDKAEDALRSVLEESKLQYKLIQVMVLFMDQR